MDSDRSELSALATSLDDITARVTGVADRYRGSPQSHISDGLDEVERALGTASRQLERVLRSMR